MNEFTAKKLGEVLAFARVGSETFEKGQAALEQVLGAERVTDTIRTLQQRASEIELAAREAGIQDITLAKAEGTGTKLRSMRELYVGDEWDNPAELLEWSGFFEGAAVVHWELVCGASKALDDDTLKTLAQTGRDFHHDTLHQVGDAIRELGTKKAQAA